MFNALLRSRMTALFSSFFASLRKKGGRSAGKLILIIILAVYVVGCFAMMFGGYFSALCAPLAESGLGWLYFTLAGITAFALCFIGSVFTAQKQLFDAKDNDLLLSMPIPPSYILGSRMLMLLALSYIFELLVMGPAGVVWCMEYTPSVRGVVVFLVCCLVLPLLSLTFSCLLGWLLSIITARVRKKSLVSTVCSLAFLAAYFYFFSNLNGYLTQLVANSAAIGDVIHSSVYPAWAFGAAIAEGSLSGLLGWLATCILPLAVVYIILMQTFIKVTTTKRGAAKIKYREREMKVKSQSGALLGRELKHFFANSMYVMNAGLGSILTIAAAVALVIYRGTLLQLSAQFGGLDVTSLIAAALCLMATTSMVSAPSVSLEGKNLWIIRSLPVSSRKVLMAKVNCHLSVALPPVLLTSIVSVIVFRPTLTAVLAALLAPAAMTLFEALLGVVMNLCFPRLDYTNEVAVVKQSMSVVVTMLGTMGVTIAIGALYFFVLRSFVGLPEFMLLVSAILALFSFILYRILTGSGVRRFESLG